MILLLDQLGNWLESVGVDNASEAVYDIFDPAVLTILVSMTLTNVSGIFGTGLLVLLAVIFMLSEAPTLLNKLRVAFSLTEDGEARLIRVLSAVNQYMGIKILTSLATAVHGELRVCSMKPGVFQSCNPWNSV